MTAAPGRDAGRASVMGAVPPPVPGILQALRTAPSRTWSVIMTVFGDVVVPRGGSMGAGPLLEVLAGMGIGGGVVRTALSRLSRDGWLSGNRVGRNSFYTLTEKGRTAAAAAAARIYGPPHPAWDGRLSVLLPDPALAEGADRTGAREAMAAAGFGSPAPGVWIAPATVPVPGGSGLLRIEGAAEPEQGRRLAERAWPLAATAAAYDRFLETFAPLDRWTAAGGPLGDHQALVARILLIHEYRRVVLRDPRLPAGLLRPDWAGARAWALCGRVYPALRAGSERWLDRHATNESGPLPPAVAALDERFAGGTHITE